MTAAKITLACNGPKHHVNISVPVILIALVLLQGLRKFAFFNPPLFFTSPQCLFQLRKKIFIQFRLAVAKQQDLKFFLGQVAYFVPGPLDQHP